MAKNKALTAPPKGTRDFLPDVVRRRRHVTGIIRSVYEAHGFEPLETPAYERLDTLLGKYGDEGDQLVFKILHRGQPLVDGVRRASAHLDEPGAVVSGRSGETVPGAEPMLADLGLRYDLTVPLARVVAEHRGKLPPVLKRYQIQPVWRADTPGKGRFREFYQCDVDIVGSPSRLVEAEVAGAVAECMQRLGFSSFSIRLNHRHLLRAVIELSGIPVELETPAIVAVDKLDKIGPEGVAAELEAKGVSGEAGKHLLEIVGESRDLESMSALVAGHELGEQAVQDLRTVVDFTRSTPACEHITFDVSLARGLGYYTGAIFEINVTDLAGSLGGGGRYDGLIGMFSGQDVPACGLSLGLERILVVMESRGMFPAGLSGVDVVLAAAHRDRMSDVLKLAYRLRAAGVRTDLSAKVEKPGRLRKRAEERGVPFAVWLERDPEVAKLWSHAERETEAPSTELSVDAVVERLTAARERSGA